MEAFGRNHKDCKMIIKSIELKNFRNYEELNLNLDGGTNILYGDNAQGKTNISRIHLCQRNNEIP